MQGFHSILQQLRNVTMQESAIKATLICRSKKIFKVKTLKVKWDNCVQWMSMSTQLWKCFHHSFETVDDDDEKDHHQLSWRLIGLQTGEAEESSAFYTAQGFGDLYYMLIIEANSNVTDMNSIRSFRFSTLCTERYQIIPQVVTSEHRELIIPQSPRLENTTSCIWRNIVLTSSRKISHAIDAILFFFFIFGTSKGDFIA